MTPTRRPLDRLLILLLAVALAVLGTVRPAPSLAAGGPDLSAYALPDGTLPTICAAAQDGASHPMGSDARCPACLAAKAFLVAPAVAPPPRALVAVAVPVARAPSAVLPRSYARAPPARGPPIPSVA